jgi:hypothetical protein
MNSELKLSAASEELEKYKEISDFAERQINRAWKAYTILLPLIALVISVGLVLFYFQYGNSLESIERSIQSRTQIVKEEVKGQIKSELETEKIQKLILHAAHEAAVKQINVKKIQDIIDSKVDKIVTNELVKLKSDIGFLQEEVVDAQQEAILIFDMIVVLENAPYDILMLEKLKEFSVDKSPKNKNSVIESLSSYIASFSTNKINNIIKVIERDHNRLTKEYWGYTVFDDQFYGIKDSKNWALEDYQKNFDTILDDQKHVYMIGVFNLKKFDELTKLKFAKYILENGSQPICIYAACEYINKKAKINRDYLFERDSYELWLNDNI